MIPISIVAAPVIGGAIGYITNGIAVKMLFRPLRPIYIGKKKLPFTPGLIPKEKERVAKRMGKLVSEELLSGEALQAALLAPQVTEQLCRSIDDVYASLVASDETVEDFLERNMTLESYLYMKTHGEDMVAALISEKLEQMDFETLVGEQAIFYVRDGLKDNMGLKMMLSLLPDEALKGIGRQIGKMIHQWAEVHAPKVVQDMVRKEGDRIAAMPLSEVAEKVEQGMPKIKEMLLSAYRKMVEEKLSSILSAMDLGGIVEQKILSYDNRELERLLLSLMKKELCAIVWLGAVLGCLIGLLQGLILWMG